MADTPQYSEETRKTFGQWNNRIGWALQDRPDLKPAAKLVLIRMAHLAKSGSVTCGVGTLKKLTGYSIPTIRTAVKALVAAKLIIPMGKSPGYWTNRYWLAVSYYDNRPAEPTAREQERRFPRTKGRAAAEGIPVKSLPVSTEAEPSIPVKSLPVIPVKNAPLGTPKGVNKKKKGLPSSIQTSERPASATLRLDATANAAPRLPSASNGDNINGNHPSGYRHVMDDLDEAYERYRADQEARAEPKPEPEPKPAEVTAAAARLSEEVVSCCGRPLDGAWARYPDLARELAKRNRREVVKILSSVLEGSGGWEVPEPGEFFTFYEPLRDAWQEGQKRQVNLARRRNGRRRRAA